MSEDIIYLVRLYGIRAQVSRRRSAILLADKSALLSKCQEQRSSGVRRRPSLPQPTSIYHRSSIRTHCCHQAPRTEVSCPAFPEAVSSIAHHSCWSPPQPSPCANHCRCFLPLPATRSLPDLRRGAYLERPPSMAKACLPSPARPRSSQAPKSRQLLPNPRSSQASSKICQSRRHRHRHHHHHRRRPQIDQTLGAQLSVYLFGAHVTSWKNEHGEEVFFSSRKATFEPPMRTHGGIRICFPQFEKHGSLQVHGFARRRFWRLDPNPPPLPETSHRKAFVDLILKPSGQDLNIWPQNFEFRLRVTLAPGGDLILTSRIRNVNTDGKPFSFSFAYHLYFPVISEVQIEGLETDYLDDLKNKERFTEEEESEADKIYLGSSTHSETAGVDQWKIQYVLTKDGLPGAGSGSPWVKKSKGLVDVGKDETDLKLCVETAAVENPITLNPGKEWKGILEVYPIPAA